MHLHYAPRSTAKYAWSVDGCDEDKPSFVIVKSLVDYASWKGNGPSAAMAQGHKKSKQHHSHRQPAQNQQPSKARKWAVSLHYHGSNIRQVQYQAACRHEGYAYGSCRLSLILGHISLIAFAVSVAFLHGSTPEIVCAALPLLLQQAQSVRGYSGATGATVQA